MGTCQKPEQTVEDYIWLIYVLHDPAISGDDVIPVSGVEQDEYDKYTLAVILPFVFSSFPIFIMYSAFEQIPDSVVEAARLDGAGGFKIFIYMAVPIAKRGILAAVILGFLEYWNIVEQPVVFLKDKSLLPLSVYLPDVTEGCAGKTFAFALFSCIPSLIIFYIGKDILAEGISIGSADG